MTTTLGPRALVIVRNPATHDSRILREARALAGLGYRPLILAVVSEHEHRRRAVQQGIPIVRLAPTSPLAWFRARLAVWNRARPEHSPVDETGDTGAASAREATAAPLRFVVRLHRWLRTIDFYRRAIGVVRRIRPQIVHCNDYNTMWIGVAARALGATVIYDSHELWPDRNLRPEPRWWLLACESLFVRVANCTVTASPGYSEVISRRYRVSPPAVIRNIPDRASDAVAGRRRPRASRPELLYLGALTRNRGLEVSIGALSQLAEARLRLIGTATTAYRAELLQLSRRRGVAHRLEIADPVPSDQVLAAIAGADVGLALIQPACLSYRLCLPNKLFEYVAAGIPVLGSNLPVISSFIREHAVGLLASPDDESEVAAKLSELLEPGRNEAFRRAARQAAALLRWEDESRLLSRIYRDATTASGSVAG